jgi:hypothetical protein
METEEFEKDYNKTLRDFGEVSVVVKHSENKAIREHIMTDAYDIIDDEVMLFRKGMLKRITKLSEIIDVY